MWVVTYLHLEGDAVFSNKIYLFIKKNNAKDKYNNIIQEIKNSYIENVPFKFDLEEEERTYKGIKEYIIESELDDKYYITIRHQLSEEES